MLYNEGWPNGPLEGPGYYLALAFDSDDWDEYDRIQVGLDPSEGTGLVDIQDDPDKNGVFKITSTATQKLVVKTTAGTEVNTVEYSLNGITKHNLNPICQPVSGDNISCAGVYGPLTMSQDDIEVVIPNVYDVPATVSGTISGDVTGNIPTGESKEHVALRLSPNLLYNYNEPDDVCIISLLGNDDTPVTSAVSISALSIREKTGKFAFQVAGADYTPEDIKSIVIEYKRSDNTKLLEITLSASLTLTVLPNS